MNPWWGEKYQAHLVVSRQYLNGFPTKLYTSVLLLAWEGREQICLAPTAPADWASLGQP